MSLFYTIMIRRRDMFRKLRGFFPGVFFDFYRFPVSLKGLEKLVSCGYDDLPDNLKDFMDLCELNRGLAEVIGRKLDRFYCREEAEYYLDNFEVFRNSFAVYRGILHSAEYIIKDIEDYSFVVREALPAEDGADILCDYKILSVSDRYCPGHAIRKAVIHIPVEQPESFVSVLNRLLAQRPYSSEREYLVKGCSLPENLLPAIN